MHLLRLEKRPHAPLPFRRRQAGHRLAHPPHAVRRQRAIQPLPVLLDERPGPFAAVHAHQQRPQHERRVLRPHVAVQRAGQRPVDQLRLGGSRPGPAGSAAPPAASARNGSAVRTPRSGPASPACARTDTTAASDVGVHGVRGEDFRRPRLDVRRRRPACRGRGAGRRAAGPSARTRPPAAAQPSSDAAGVSRSRTSAASRGRSSASTIRFSVWKEPTITDQTFLSRSPRKWLVRSRYSVERHQSGQHGGPGVVDEVEALDGLQAGPGGSAAAPAGPARSGRGRSHGRPR